jgi:hypothetical protein
MIGVFIARFCAIYTNVDLQARVRAMTLKPQQNPAPHR